MPSGPIRTVGVLGAGKSGIAIARLALRAGYRVRIATSGPADRTALVTGVLTPGAEATDATGIATDADAIVLAVPLRRFRELPLDTLADRTVIDVMNYWPTTDGALEGFETDGRPSSLDVRDALPSNARLVKTFNHIGYHEMEELARPRGVAGRVGLAVTGEDEAVAAVMSLVDDVGFDPVDAGGLEESGLLQPGSAIFGADLTAMRIRAVLREEKAALGGDAEALVLQGSRSTSRGGNMRGI